MMRRLCALVVMSLAGLIPASPAVAQLGYTSVQLGTGAEFTQEPQVYVGDATATSDYYYQTWDADPSDGYDTGWVAVTSVFEPGAYSITAGATAATGDFNAFSEVTEVVLSVGAWASQRRAEVRNVRVTFYNATDTEELSLSSSGFPVADTLADTTGGATAYDDVVIQPDGVGYLGVKVEYEVRLRANTTELGSTADVGAYVQIGGNW